MLRVALTGGIASGKTEVSNRLGDLGALVIDADLLAREVVEPGTPALKAVIERFGDGVLDQGRLDRRALGSIVFADPVARSELERIIHPAVRARAAEIEAQAADDAVIVHVIPLLVETGTQSSFDLCVVVDSDEDTQIERLIRRSSLNAAEAKARIDSQATRAQRLAVADYVLDNSGTVQELEKQVDDLWADLASAAHRR